MFITLRDEKGKHFLQNVNHIVSFHPRDESTCFLETTVDVGPDATFRRIGMSLEEVVRLLNHWELMK